MRPELDKNIEPDTFIDYYWLKEELVKFCKDYKLPTSGSKEEITQRIYEYLKTGEILKPSKKYHSKSSSEIIPLTLDTLIPEGYKNDERHRAFFKKEIGGHFKFNVPFMNWMKSHAGKTYSDAVNEWNSIYEEKKQGKKTKISSQFQYNQYTRDFYSANPDAKRDDVITCWKYKRSLPGHNRYEDSDLDVLNS